MISILSVLLDVSSHCGIDPDEWIWQSLIIAQIYIYIFHLSLPVIMSGMVFEKENKLREIMKMVSIPV